MFFDFDREFYRFSRNLKDMYPYEIIAEENKVVIVHNVVGLSKEDIKISGQREGDIDFLVISGEKKNEITDKIYKVDSRFQVNANKIQKVDWEVKDGLLYIEVFLKEPEKPKFEINYKK